MKRLQLKSIVAEKNRLYSKTFFLQVDSTADYIVPEDRVNLDYPAPFGRDATPEEAKIAELDGKTGASLKVT